MYNLSSLYIIKGIILCKGCMSWVLKASKVHMKLIIKEINESLAVMMGQLLKLHYILQKKTLFLLPDAGAVPEKPSGHVNLIAIMTNTI